MIPVGQGEHLSLLPSRPEETKSDRVHWLPHSDFLLNHLRLLRLLLELLLDRVVARRRLDVVDDLLQVVDHVVHLVLLSFHPVMKMLNFLLHQVDLVEDLEQWSLVLHWHHHLGPDVPRVVLARCCFRS